MSIRDIGIGAVGSVFLTLAAMLGLHQGGDSGPAAHSPQPVTILDICQRPATTFKLVQTENGPQMQGKYDAADVRYDLTWQPSGTVVAIEALYGANFVASVEQITPAFTDCVNAKGWQIQERGQ